jgi:hypothetical protein
MTYYSSLPWWDSAFKVRRFINLTPFEYNPGSESLVAVRILKKSLAGKIKSDYSDLVVVANNTALVPFYVLDEGDYVAVVFEPTTPVVISSDSVYCLYYNNKTRARLTTDSDILDPESFSLESTPTDADTRWLFTRPTEDWSSGLSNSVGASSIFEFIGHRAKLTFKTGSDKGKLAFSVNNGLETIADSFSLQDSTSTLITINSTEIMKHKIKLRVLGEGSPQSSDSKVEIEKATYHQVLISELISEEFYSEIGQTVSVPGSA